MGTVDKQTRSRMMANIKGKNTKPEMTVRSLLHRQGFRFRLYDKSLPGKPDLVLRKYKAVIFVHGCYWHQQTFSVSKNTRLRCFLSNSIPIKNSSLSVFKYFC